MSVKLLLFCAAFVGGIAGAMLRPPWARPWPYWGVAGVLALAAGVACWWRARARPLGRWGWPAGLALAGLALGVARFGAANERPDRRVATIRVERGEARLSGRADWGEASRLRLRKETPGTVVVRLEGSLAAHHPVTDGRGTPQLDARGRWRLREWVAPQVSADVRLDSGLPLGAEVAVDVPFSAVERVVVLEAPERARVGLVRVSAHVASFARPGRNTPPVTLLGRIVDDPAVYAHQTVLAVRPEFLQEHPEGPLYRVAGGRVRVSVNPGVPGYTVISRTEATGNDVVLHGSLQRPLSAANPGGFDFRQYLARNGFFAQMMLWPSRAEPDRPLPLRVVAPEGGAPRRGGRLVMFSLQLRDRMLRVIKQTLPHPHSAFVGGVTLGMRYGLQGVECILSPDSESAGLHGLRRLHAPCRSFIAEEFRHAGVNHVLAVSGLHVTIITVMLIGVFSALRIARKAYAPVVLMALVVFAIITGSRPSTLRAVIMNGIFLLSWTYLGQTLQSSVLLGVPVAALLILWHSPALLVDPSFTLSFGAILSLALLTAPCHRVLSRFRGNDLLALAVAVLAAHGVLAREWLLFSSPVFLLLFAAFVLALFAAGRRAWAFGLRPLGGRGFADLPVVINGFLAAQCAIQLGMMIPLSAYYFSRWPVAGAAANLLAIPLIGVVLQLAMLACLLGLVPGIGLWLALLLSAANWVVATAFMLVAHHASSWFPYPFVRRPGGLSLVVYFGAIALFAGWDRVQPHLARSIPWRRPAVRAGLVLTGLAVIWVVWPGPERLRHESRITVLAVNYGSAVLVQTPGGRNVLIDGGYALRERNRAVEAERNVLPYLSRLGIRRLDTVVALSARPERLDGIAEVLEHCRVRRLVLPPGVAELFDARQRLRMDRVEAALGTSTRGPAAEARESLSGFPTAGFSMGLDEVLSRRAPTVFNRLTGLVIRVEAGLAGDVLIEGRTPGGAFALEVLAPTAAQAGGDVLSDGSLALGYRHGEFGMLLPGDLDYAELHRALTGAAASWPAQVLIAPTRGVGMPPDVRSATHPRFEERLRETLEATVAPLLDARSVRQVWFEFGNPRPVLKYTRNAHRARDVAEEFYRSRLGEAAVRSTDRDGALFVETDGRTYRLSSQAERLREGVEDDGTTSLAEVGGY